MPFQVQNIRSEPTLTITEIKDKQNSVRSIPKLIYYIDEEIMF